MAGNERSLTPPPVSRAIMENREQVDRFVSGEVQSLKPALDVPGDDGHILRPVVPKNFPWRDNKVSSKHKQLMTVRVPEDEYLMARFLGETTYGESIQLIALRGLRQEIKRMMRERGVEVTEDATGKLVPP